MAIDNWKLWIVPFAVWGATMAWYTGYQAGYQEGHQTAWQMSLSNTASFMVNATMKDYRPGGEGSDERGL